MSNKWKNIILGWTVLLTVGIAFMFYYFSSKNSIIEQKYQDIINEKSIEKVDYAPFIVYPEKKDSLGNLTLTPENLENIKKHMEFLENRVSSTISEAKQEVNNDINRLNTLATWWIGILTILAGLFPVAVNIAAKIDIDKAFDGKLNNAKKEAKEAFDNSEIAKKGIKEASDKLKKFEKDFSGLDTETKEAKKNATEALKLSKESKESATTAENAAKEAKSSALEAKNKVESLEKITNTTAALSKLKTLDSKSMEFIKNRLNFFIEQLELIENQLSTTLSQDDSFFQNDIVKENFQSFYISIRSFRILFKEKKVTEAITFFHNALETELAKGMSKEVVASITTNLKELIKKLKEN